MVAALLVAGPITFAYPAMAQDQDAETSGPAIIQLDPATEARDGDVKVIRGSAVHPEPVARNTSSKAVPNGGLELVGGDTLWLVDRKASVLTGCFLAATIVAGDLRDIRCESAELR
jgi:hypothetical protein